MEITTYTRGSEKTRKEITIKSTEDSYRFMVSGPGLPGEIRVKFDRYNEELCGPVEVEGKERNLRVRLRSADVERIGKYVSSRLRASDRNDNIARHAAEYAEAVETGSRVFVKAELDDDMNVHRHYITPAGDMTVTRESAH